MKNWLTAEKREAIYGATVLYLPVLVAYGVVEESKVALILGAVGGTLTLVMALFNTPTKARKARAAEKREPFNPPHEGSIHDAFCEECKAKKAEPSP